MTAVEMQWRLQCAIVNRFFLQSCFTSLISFQPEHESHEPHTEFLKAKPWVLVPAELILLPCLE